MVAPWVIPAATAALQYLGSREDTESGEQIAEQNNNLQREFAQHGIRWKVADAQAAGLHPLFALGGNTATYTPNPIPVNNSHADLGQNLGRAVQAAGTPSERELQQAQLDHLQAQTEKEHAMSAYYASEAARTRQQAGQTSPLPLDQFGDPIAGQVVAKPDEVVSARVGNLSQTAANSHPALTNFAFSRDGDRPVDVLAPSQLAAESFEGLGEIGKSLLIPGTIATNVRRYGWRWISDVLNGGHVFGDGADPAFRAMDRTVEKAREHVSNWLYSLDPYSRALVFSQTEEKKRPVRGSRSSSGKIKY